MVVQQRAVVDVKVRVDDADMIRATGGIASMMRELEDKALAASKVLQDIGTSRQSIATLAALAKEATKTASAFEGMETELKRIMKTEQNARAAFKSIKSMMEYKPTAGAGMMFGNKPAFPDLKKLPMPGFPRRVGAPKPGGGAFKGLPPNVFPIMMSLFSPSVIGAVINRYDPMLKTAADRYFLEDVDPRINEYLLGTTPGFLYGATRMGIDKLQHPDGLPTLPDPRYRGAREGRAREAEELKADKSLSFYGGEPPPPKWPVALGGNVYWVESEEQYERLMKGVAKGSIDTWAPHKFGKELFGTRWQKPHEAPLPQWRDDKLFDTPEKVRAFVDTPLGLTPPGYGTPRTPPPFPPPKKKAPPGFRDIFEGTPGDTSAGYNFVLGGRAGLDRQDELESAQIESLELVEEVKAANHEIELARIEAMAESYVSYVDPAPFIVEGLKSGEVRQAIEDFGIALGTKAAEELVHKLIVMGVMAVLSMLTGGASQGVTQFMSRGGVIKARGGLLGTLPATPGGHFFPFGGKLINAAEGGEDEVLGIFPKGQRGVDLITKQLMPMFNIPLMQPAPTYAAPNVNVENNIETRPIFNATVKVTNLDPHDIKLATRVERGKANKSVTIRE